MRSVIHNFKNVNYGEVTYMNNGSINSRGKIEKTDIVGIYGQNGSGKTALVEALDILRCIIAGNSISYKAYAGMMAKDEPVCLITDFFVEKEKVKYKVRYEVSIRADNEQNNIQIYKEKLTYWKRGASWIAKRSMEFENPYYEQANISLNGNLSVISKDIDKYKDITFLSNMHALALLCSQQCCSVFFNKYVLGNIRILHSNEDVTSFKDIICGIMQFGLVNLSVVKVNQLGTINRNQSIPINVHNETDTSIMSGIVFLNVNETSEILEAHYDQVETAITAINIVLRSIIPNLKIELVKGKELEKPDGRTAYEVELYSNRDGKRFLIMYESEGIKRIISILNYLIAVFNNPGICLVVDELDSGIFEYLLGELLGLMHREMKGQLIFTSHNLRILEKLDAKNIVCSTVNPNNRYIRLTGIEKNHNKRDYYIRAITVGGQKEDLYDEDDLIAMGYAFRKAGNTTDAVTLKFSTEIESKLQNNSR